MIGASKFPNEIPRSVAEVPIQDAANSRKAIVTIAIDRYADLWRTRCRGSWHAYARRHGYELICFDRPLDTSDRARSRSPAWQKLLILEQPELRGFDRVVWVDADIVINMEAAPCIIEGVEPAKIGVVDEMALFSNPIAANRRASFDEVLRRRENVYGVPIAPDPYAAWGLTPSFPILLNTGVMTLTAVHHSSLFRHVYDAYEDKGMAGYNAEMRPLSYEILSRGIHQLIDSRFNVIWPHYVHIFHPLLDPQRRFLTGLAFALAAAYTNSWFLHFAGRQSDMDYLPYVSEKDGVFFLRGPRRRKIYARMLEEMKSDQESADTED